MLQSTQCDHQSIKRKGRSKKELTKSERLVISLVPGTFKGTTISVSLSTAAGTYSAKFIDVTPATEALVFGPCLYT